MCVPKLARSNTDPENLAHLPVNVALGCGRPVLVVPGLASNATVGKSVLVAWNGTREATRALHDAMPILQTADYVNVVTFSPKDESLPAIDISNHRECSGVTFDIVNTTATDSEIPEKLLHFIEQFDTDLLVMGAYGHSRLREYVMGGVSRSIFKDIQIPLYVSH